MQGSPDHASRIEAGAAASTSGRTGVPTKVMSHKKATKQLTNLAVVQELFAHTGHLAAMYSVLPMLFRQQVCCKLHCAMLCSALAT